MATCMEHLAALGWHVFGSSDRFPICKLKDVIESLKLTPQQVKTLRGNSMHLLTQMSFMLYILAHCGKKTADCSNQPARISSWEEFWISISSQIAMIAILLRPLAWSYRPALNRNLECWIDSAVSPSTLDSLGIAAIGERNNMADQPGSMLLVFPS